MSATSSGWRRGPARDKANSLWNGVLGVGQWAFTVKSSLLLAYLKIFIRKFGGRAEFEQWQFKNMFCEHLLCSRRREGSLREVGSQGPTWPRAAAGPSLLDPLKAHGCICAPPLTPSRTLSAALQLWSGDRGHSQPILGGSCLGGLPSRVPGLHIPLSASLSFLTLLDRTPGPREEAKSRHSPRDAFRIQFPSGWPSRGHVKSNNPSPRKAWFLCDGFA